MIVFGAIAPHGNPVFEQPDGPTARGMLKLTHRLRDSGAEAAILVTPHGTLLDGHFGVVRSARLAEHPNQFVEAEHLYEGEGAPELADASVCALQDAGLPALGMTFGTTVAGGSVMPVDWGAGIPLTFLRLPAVVVTPCRELSNSQHVRAGAALAAATGERRVAFVASADHGHGLTHDGPYGFSEHSQPYDDDVQDAVRRNALGELVGWDAQRARAAFADSFWQLLMLHGALGDGFEAELLSYEAPTYFGMLTASFTREE
ncbi:MAG: DODA-type extradiol aromatic ring-opening family dioxygenase [Gaiellaceae bacterium]